MLEAGRNCWKLGYATRAAVLVDAEEYFQAVAWALSRARKTICILAWDLDTRISLLPREARNGGKDPGTLPLAEFLFTLAERNPDLEIYILAWDFLFLYANERELRRTSRRKFGRHPRIHFDFDKEGPLFVSHHQKVIVVDDQLAFSGGLDLTQRRWDTPEHPVECAERTDPSGASYEPFHDVQIMVEGPVARDLGRIFRDRWGARPFTASAPAEPNPSLWPERFPPLVRDTPIAIARSAPAYRGRPEIRECERLFLDTLREAKEYLYIENQYFTSHKIERALLARLGEENPPEIVILVRKHNSKWIEAVSMALYRNRIVKKLRAADKKGKCLVLCPYSSVERGICTNLHSKVMIADDRFVRVGSANLCDRSQAMDTECDLAFELNGAGKLTARGLRDRLLAEHLGVSREELEWELARTGSLVGAVRALQGKRDHTLVDCPDRSKALFEWFGLNQSLVDPESPREFRKALLRFAGYASVFLVVAVLALKASDWAEIRTVQEWIRTLNRQPWAWAGLVGLFALLTIIPLPLLPLALVFALLLPAWQTFLVTMAGTLIAASSHYGLGRLLVRRMGADHLESDKLQEIRDMLRDEGIWPILLLRLVPVAPFWFVNFAMSFVGVKFRHYLIATILGLLPGFLLIAHFEDNIQRQSGAKLGLALALFVLLFWALTKFSRRLAESRSHADRS